MQQAFIGFVGLLIGILLNEYLRRRNRVEIYSSKVFERRLEAYEGLMAAIRVAESEVSEVLEDESTPLADRHERAFEAGLGVVKYADEHSLYLNDEITVHCGASWALEIFSTCQKGKSRPNRLSALEKCSALPRR